MSEVRGRECMHPQSGGCTGKEEAFGISQNNSCRLRDVREIRVLDEGN